MRELRGRAALLQTFHSLTQRDRWKFQSALNALGAAVVETSFLYEIRGFEFWVWVLPIQLAWT